MKYKQAARKTATIVLCAARAAVSAVSRLPGKIMSRSFHAPTADPLSAAEDM